ncbi:MAG TPA: acylphosphatase [Chloroflexia bacterium]
MTFSALAPVRKETCKACPAFDYGVSTAVQYQVVENNTSPSAYEPTAHASELQTLRATVRGRVQNVGFRMYVLEAARRLDLAGYVRNDYDGSVEVVAAGQRGALDQLLLSLRRGPAHARVDQVAVEWQAGNSQRLAAPFEVRA